MGYRSDIDAVTSSASATQEDLTQLTLDFGNHNHDGTYEPADATILKDADIGVTVQAYDSTILVDGDIGVNVAAYNHNHSGTYEPSGTVSSHVDATDPHPDIIDDLTDVTSVAETDLVMVSQSGTNKKATMNQVTEAIFGDDWDDLVIPGTAVNPPGAASDPTLNQTTGLYEFSGTADNVITFCWQLPHGWSGAWDANFVTVVPHLHVRCLTASGNVSRWKFEYDKASVNGSFTNAYGTFTNLGTVSLTNPNDTTKHKIIDFGNLALTGHGISTLVHAKISRLANSDNDDTDTGLIALYSADLHIRRKRWGTEYEYSDTP